MPIGYQCRGCRALFAEWRWMTAHEAVCPAWATQQTIWAAVISKAKAEEQERDARTDAQRQRRADNRAYKKQRLALIGQRERAS